MSKLFICHASEDKAQVARPLAEALLQAGLEVWYDEYSLKLGDSLRREIDRGLSQCDYGVVIISPSFFEKEWPQIELDGLFAKEIDGSKTILPVWHEVDRVGVTLHSPILADRYAAKTSDGLDTVVARILDVVKPEASHLTVAGKTVSVTPTSIRLHSGEWAVKTPIRILNHADRPAYSVQVKLALDPFNLDSKSIHIDLGHPTTLIDEPVADVNVSLDGVLLYFLDQTTRECLSVTLHTLDPKSAREVQIAGTVPIKSSASIELWDFKTTPPEVLRKGGAVAFPISVPESVQSKGMALLLRRPR